MLKKKSDIYNVVLIVIAFLINIAVYSKLPDQIPTHWNVAGEIDRYSPKVFGAFMAPVIMLVVWLGMKFLPNIDPKKKNYEKFNSSYSIIICLLTSFFFVLNLLTITVSLGYNISINKVIPLIIGILFIILGNYMPKSKSNFFYGIKTPWTLTSDVSWRKTHRLGGKLFVLDGIIVVISSIFLTGTVQVTIFVISTSIAALVPIVASYFYAKNDNSNNSIKR
jgi:uncharacterized membrane protein